MWDLIPRPPGANVVTDKWIFKHKLKVDGSLDRYKARWVLQGFTQRTKHVEIDLYFVCDRVDIEDVRVVVEDVCVLHVPCTSHFANIFTKGLSSSVFSEFRSSLRRLLSLSTSSPRGYPPQSFGLVSTSTMASVSTAGGGVEGGMLES
jgi:hypothetical protein